MVDKITFSYSLTYSVVYTIYMNSNFMNMAQIYGKLTLIVVRFYAYPGLGVEVATISVYWN
jgi:hypothetical protein